MKPRVAIIGARGIGRHHAKWFHFEGCEVVAFVGTSDETNAQTRKALQELFGFDGRDYTSVGEMLARERPDMVCVSSPPEWHYEHVMAAAEAGCHVFCEKPLVWHEGKSAREMMELGQDMVEALEGEALAGAINTQYVAALEPYYELCRQLGIKRQAPKAMFMQIDSRGRRGPVSYEDIWRDLGSHPVSVMMAFCGFGRIDNASLEVTCAEKEFRAKFTYLPETGPECQCELVCCNRPEGKLVRRLGINGHLMDYEGRTDGQGRYRAWCCLDGRELWWDDFVQISVRRFIAATRAEERPLATIRDGLANLGFQLQILSAARRV